MCSGPRISLDGRITTRPARCSRGIRWVSAVTATVASSRASGAPRQ